MTETTRTLDPEWSRCGVPMTLVYQAIRRAARSRKPCPSWAELMEEAGIESQDHLGVILYRLVEAKRIRRQMVGGQRRIYVEADRRWTGWARVGETKVGREGA